ncbi:outer membrane protein assembly factor BamD [Nitrosophilus kaiyonis]|uniref:outer membrane protein assembly factor BamD n=1 Tax=Nitrosophilus kaiyonis TaxID=2930200 RepID=UPI002492C7BF|nr:outer membrane protein assembly factor BamD [Nitrosophilus kaiyonis]
MRKLGIFLMIIFIVMISGCSSKKETEYNKPAIYWYEKIIKSVSSSNLDRADEYFTSLESEHISSPLIPEAMLILAQAHMDNEEYLMASFYLDEYIKRYSTAKKREFAEYLKIKSSFLGFKNINRDQKLLNDTIQNALNYKKMYPNSEFIPLVDTILTKLYMTEYILNKNIMLLYQRRDKPKAAKIYEEKLKKSWLNETEIIKPENWYDVLIEW